MGARNIPRKYQHPICLHAEITRDNNIMVLKNPERQAASLSEAPLAWEAPGPRAKVSPAVAAP